MIKQPWNKNKSVGQKIKERREQLGLTLEKVAKKVGVQKQRIHELEATSKRPSAEKLFKIATVLEAPIAYFLDENCQKLDDVDEEVLLVRFRKLDDRNKKLVINLVKAIEKIYFT